MDIKGFYPLPSYPNYGINCNGQVCNYASHRILRCDTSGRVRIRDKHGQYVMLSVAPLLIDAGLMKSLMEEKPSF